LVIAGLSPIEALRSATVNPAKFLDLDKTLGTIEQGKIADLALLDANPLEDIRNTQRINAVISNGRLFDRKALDKMLAQAEAATNRQ
jgi:imidazolonepropionase-like amidohydrolase